MQPITVQLPSRGPEEEGGTPDARRWQCDNGPTRRKDINDCYQQIAEERVSIPVIACVLGCSRGGTTSLGPGTV
jgi:hypothetical protein